MKNHNALGLLLWGGLQPARDFSPAREARRNLCQAA